MRQHYFIYINNMCVTCGDMEGSKILTNDRGNDFRPLLCLL